MNGLERYAKTETKRMILIIVIYAIGAFSVPYVKIAELFGGSKVAEFLVGFVCKSACAILPIYLISELAFKNMFKPQKGFLKGLLLCIPAFIVAIDNFPILPQITGYMSINVQFFEGLAYVLFCLSIGLLEESIFRGNILPLFMYTFKRNKRGLFLSVVISSAIFGAMHLLNLFGGFSAAVFLQVGYSFLIGCTCALAMLMTGNLLTAVAIHAIFDMGGFLSDYFGSGTLWTTENIILTAVVSLICALALVIVFFKKDFSDVYENWGLNELPLQQ